MMGVMAAASAQSAPQRASERNLPDALDVSVTYTASYAGLSSGSNNFWLQGGSAELSARVWRGLSEAANVTGLHTADSGNGVPVNVVTATFGPRYTWVHNGASRRDVQVFGEFLVGIASGFSGYYPEAGGATDSATSLALLGSGGVDYKLNRRLTLRLVQVNWLRTQLPNASTNVQNNLTLGAGIVFRVK